VACDTGTLVTAPTAQPRSWSSRATVTISSPVGPTLIASLYVFAPVHSDVADAAESVTACRRSRSRPMR